MSSLDPIFSEKIALDISGVLSFEIDQNKLFEEVKMAQQATDYARRTPHWLGIPLRSVYGELGENAMKATGIYNSPDETLYQDTKAMTPYIRKIIDDIGAPTFKVRILKLKAKKAIGEHADNFQADDIIRLHIPIATHPLVEFWLDGEHYFIPPQRLSYLNVRKRHKVLNNSHIDRIHLVIDVKQTPELIEKVNANCKIINPF